MCASYVLQQQQHQIGGVGFTIEIDEAMFSRRKNHVGRVLPQQWCFGGICRETRESFLVAVDDRSANTLIPIIIDKIAPGSTIISDGWAAYNTVIYMILCITN